MRGQQPTSECRSSSPKERFQEEEKSTYQGGLRPHKTSLIDHLSSNRSGKVKLLLITFKDCLLFTPGVHSLQLQH